MFENLRLSFRGIYSHKMRSALTMLGIVIGIAAIIIIVSLINGVSAQMKNEMVGGSSNTVMIGVYESDSMYGFSMEYNASSRGAIPGMTTISDSKLAAVKDVKGVTDATRVYASTYSDATMRYLGNSGSVNATGIDVNYFEVSDSYLIAGRLFTKHDFDDRNNVVIIDDQTANSFFRNDDPLGKTVQIGKELFTIVGIVKKPIDYSEIENIDDYQMKMGYGGSAVYVPLTSWNDVNGYDDIQTVLIKIEDPDYIVKASNQVADVLNGDNMSGKVVYKSGSLSTDDDYLKEITNMASILLIGIASISLIVGGIGVMNIMLVSVTERTREIGLKKALGARRRVILGQFLTESIVLTSMGGIIGVLIGIGVAKLVGMIITIPAQVSAGSVALSVGFSMAIGIIFGIVPSIKASKLNPIDALRYE